jgi:hypothetical protein
MQTQLKRNINRNQKNALENLMYILNKVRNNLFHGDKRIERPSVYTIRGVTMKEIIQKITQFRD